MLLRTLHYVTKAEIRQNRGVKALSDVEVESCHFEVWTLPL